MADDSSRSLPARPSARGWFLPFGFAGLIVATYLLGVALGIMTGGEPTVHPVVFEPLLFPVLFDLAPPVLAAANELRGGSVASSLAIGLVPGLAFQSLSVLAGLFGTGNGDTPAWALSLLYGGIGALHALGGVAVAVVSRRLYRRFA